MLDQVEVLGHAGKGYTEKRTLAGAGEFIGINPRKTPEGTTNQDVSKITCIVIDIDSLTETAWPLTLAKRIAFLEDYKSYVIVNSGTGAHIYVPVDLPTNSDVKGYLEQLNKTYGDENHKIDSIGDLARVIRKWGSINPKNGNVCKVIEDHFNGINDLKLPISKPQETQRSQVLVGDIINGNRNNALTSLAGAMRNKGFTQDAIEAALLSENQTRCVPPLPEYEVKNIAKSVGRYEPKSAPKANSSVIGLSTHFDQYYKNLENRKPGYTTGFEKLDGMLAGLQKGKMYVIAARTNEGKTSFVCNVAFHLIKQGISVLYFPTELGYEPLFDKIVSQHTKIPLKKFQFGNFNQAERDSIQASIQTIRAFPFTVNEDFSLTLDKTNLRTKEVNPQVLILDFIQAMKYEEGSAQEIAENIRGIKQIAEEMQIPVIICSQLNRSAINSEISLGQLKGSGAIEEFADVVMALSTVNKTEYPRIVDLHILKSRYSEIGKVRLQFYSTVGKFVEIVDT